MGGTGGRENLATEGLLHVAAEDVGEAVFGSDGTSRHEGFEAVAVGEAADRKSGVGRLEEAEEREDRRLRHVEHGIPPGQKRKYRVVIGRDAAGSQTAGSPSTVTANVSGSTRMSGRASL